MFLEPFPLAQNNVFFHTGVDMQFVLSSCLHKPQIVSTVVQHPFQEQVIGLLSVVLDYTIYVNRWGRLVGKSRFDDIQMVAIR